MPRYLQIIAPPAGPPQPVRVMDGGDSEDGCSSEDDRTRVDRAPIGRHRDAPAGQTLAGPTIEETERDLVLRTLARHHGNRTSAARVLGISVRTLRNKIRAYNARGIAVPAPLPKRFADSARLSRL